MSLPIPHEPTEPKFELPVKKPADPPPQKPVPKQVSEFEKDDWMPDGVKIVVLKEPRMDPDLQAMLDCGQVIVQYGAWQYRYIDGCLYARDASKTGPWKTRVA